MRNTFFHSRSTPAGRRWHNRCFATGVNNYRSAPSLKKAQSLHQRGKLKGAAEIYREILASSPGHPEALHYLGLIAHQTGRLEEAVQLIVQSVQADPNDAGALADLAAVLRDQGRLAQSIQFYQAALALSPQNFMLLFNLGVLHGALNRHDEAVACYDRAIALNPKLSEAYCNLGAIFQEQGKFDKALDCFKKSLALNPRVSQVLGNMGAVLNATGRFADAVRYCESALKIDPNSEVALTNLGSALGNLGRIEEAIEVCRRALKVNPASYVALNNLAHTLARAGKPADAVPCLKQAMELKPDYPKTYINLGMVLKELGSNTEAMTYLQKAAELDPNDPEAHLGMASVSYMAGKVADAVASYRKALAIKPDYIDAQSGLLFSLNYVPHTPEEIFAECARFGKHFCEPLGKLALPHQNEPDVNRRLRVGYVSGDLRNHPLANFLEPVLAHRSRDEFEIFCYANSPIADEVTQRLRGMSDCWRQVDALSDDQLADSIRKDGIDILVDLSGHTALNRLLAFARKPAPVQVTMFGFMQTTGVPGIDYRITSEILDPSGTSEHLNTEELIRLPAGAAPFRPPADCPEVNDLPAAKNGFVTFASFNNPSKVTPEAIAAWAAVLRAVPTAKMLIFGRDGVELGRALGAHGIAPERLEFMKLLPTAEFLALHHRVDFALDTFPYNGGVTSFILTWMGVPFVTLAGNDPVSRVGQSVLTAAGLPQLVARDTAEYVSKAVDAVSELQRLAQWRKALRPNLQQWGDDGVTFTAQLEQAYRDMWQRWCEKQAPVHAPAEESCCAA
jgi:predicted O-linked N-acetylglucosamine transferase (SPINDLY family)